MKLMHWVDCPECKNSIPAELDGKSHDMIDCPLCRKKIWIELQIVPKKISYLEKAIGFIEGCVSDE